MARTPAWSACCWCLGRAGRRPAALRIAVPGRRNGRADHAPPGRQPRHRHAHPGRTAVLSGRDDRRRGCARGQRTDPEAPAGSGARCALHATSTRSSADPTARAGHSAARSCGRGLLRAPGSARHGARRGGAALRGRPDHRRARQGRRAARARPARAGLLVRPPGPGRGMTPSVPGRRAANGKTNGRVSTELAVRESAAGSFPACPRPSRWGRRCRDLPGGRLRDALRQRLRRSARAGHVGARQRRRVRRPAR